MVAGDAASEVDGTSSVIGENDPVMVDISAFTTTKILDKRSSPSGVEYRWEFEPLWLAADLVEKIKMGRIVWGCGRCRYGCDYCISKRGGLR